ncbi:MAG: hypothetical protein H0T69_07125 [Thermoleophilaceae bacterium]|nr:hypothetical protein [Thermoleophilaceae bacterium]
MGTGTARVLIHQSHEPTSFLTAEGSGAAARTARLRHGVRLDAHGTGTVRRTQLAVIPIA